MQRILLVLVAISLSIWSSGCNSGVGSVTDSTAASTVSWREVCRSADFAVEPTDALLDGLYESVRDVVVLGGTEAQIMAHITPVCKVECGAGNCNRSGCVECVLAVFHQAESDMQRASTKSTDPFGSVEEVLSSLTGDQ